MLRFHGRVREPVTASPGALEFSAGSPVTLLDRRFLQDAAEFLATPQLTIVDELLTEQNARSPIRTRLQPGFATDQPRDRSWAAGKSLAEILKELAEVGDGFWFLEQPVIDYEHAIYTEIVATSTPGVDRPEVRFEYGAGTIGNCDDYKLGFQLPENAVTLAGGGTPAPTSRVEDTDSILLYDLLEKWVSQNDVSDEAELAARGALQLRPDPVEVITFSVLEYGTVQLGGPVPPRLFFDFDVGDTVYASIRDESTELYALPVLVTAAKVVYDGTIENLELTVASEFFQHDGIFTTLRETERRLRVLEATGGTGGTTIDAIDGGAP